MRTKWVKAGQVSRVTVRVNVGFRIKVSDHVRELQYSRPAKI